MVVSISRSPINVMFKMVYKKWENDKSIEKEAIYKTLRLILKNRKRLKIQNNLKSFVNNYKDIVEFLADNVDDFKKNTKNLDFIVRLYDEEVKKELRAFETDTESESDSDSNPDTESESESDTDSNPDSDSEYYPNSSPETDSLEDIIEYVEDQIAQLECVSKKRHRTNKWLWFVNTLVSVANLAVSAVTLMKVVNYL